MPPTNWSIEVLEETPPRVTHFLSGIGALATVRRLLADAGMTDAELSEGTALLVACLAAAPANTTALDTGSARRQREAVMALDAWDEPNFARYAAALVRRFPEVHERVFRGLAASKGAASVRAVAIFLLRVEGCEHAARARSRRKVSEDVAAAAAGFAGVPAAACKGAVDLLARRGFDRGERARLGELVRVALGSTESLGALPAAEAERLARRRDAQRALKDWFEEWASVARAVVAQRAHLIRLGLAKRRSPTKAAA